MVTTTSFDQALIPECSAKLDPLENTYQAPSASRYAVNQEVSYVQSAYKNSFQPQQEQQVIQYVIYEISDSRSGPKSGAERQRKYRERKRLEALSTTTSKISGDAIPSLSLFTKNQGASPPTKGFYEQSASESGSHDTNQLCVPKSEYCEEKSLPALSSIKVIHAQSLCAEKQRPSSNNVHSSSESCSQHQKERPVSHYATNHISSDRRKAPKCEVERQKKCREKKRMARCKRNPKSGAERQRKYREKKRLEALSAANNKLQASRAPPKSGAERQTKFREKKRLELSAGNNKLQVCRGPPKSGAERQMKFREKKKLFHKIEHFQ